MYILFCVNKTKSCAKCFEKREQFVLPFISFINLKIYDEKKYQKLEHDFRLMSVPQRKKYKNIFFLFLLTTILVILVDIMLLYSYNSHMNNLT